MSAIHAGGWIRRHADWIWLACPLAVVVLVGLLFSVGNQHPQEPALSTQSAEPNGALALALWLRHSNYRVETWTSPDLPVQTLRPTRSTLMMLMPGINPTPREDGAVLSWVMHGGRLVIGSDGGTGEGILRALRLAVVPAFPANINVVQPLLLAPRTVRLYGEAPAVLLSSQGVGTEIERPSGADAAATSQGPVLLEHRLGQGTIWILTARGLLNNSHLAHADNRRLLLNLVGQQGTTVAFDQYRSIVANPSPTDLSWLTETTWGIAILFAAMALILYRWLAGQRLGPPVEPLTLERRSASEYVISMAGVLSRGRKRAEVLRIYQQELARAANRGAGKVDAFDAARRARLDGLLATPGRLTEEQLIARASDIVEWEEQGRSPRG